MSRIDRLLLVAYIVLVGLTITLLVFAGNLIFERGLAAKYVSVQGFVKGTTCADHSRFTYGFRVNGKKYEGRAISDLNTSCESLIVRDTVTVYYSPENPDQNSTREPIEGYTNELISIALAVIIIPVIIMLRVRWWLKRRSRM